MLYIATRRIKIGISNYPLLLSIRCQTIKNITLDHVPIDGVNPRADQRDLLITSSNEPYIRTKIRVVQLRFLCPEYLITVVFLDLLSSVLHNGSWS